MIHKLRTMQITMELPTEASDVWLRAALQKVIKNNDYQTVQTIDAVDAINRQLSEILTEEITVTDPFTGIVHTLNCATLSIAITEIVKRWILFENPDYHENDQGDLIKEM